MRSRVSSPKSCAHERSEVEKGTALRAPWRAWTQAGNDHDPGKRRAAGRCDKGRAPALVGRCVLVAFVSKLRLKLKDSGLEAGNGAGILFRCYRARILFRYMFRYRSLCAAPEAVFVHALCDSHCNFADRRASHGANLFRYM